MTLLCSDHKLPGPCPRSDKNVIEIFSVANQSICSSTFPPPGEISACLRCSYKTVSPSYHQKQSWQRWVIWKSIYFCLLCIQRKGTGFTQIILPYLYLILFHSKNNKKNYYHLGSLILWLIYTKFYWIIQLKTLI